MQSDPIEEAAVYTAIVAWRHWTKGNMLAFEPHPTEALNTLVLWVDDAVNKRDYDEYEDTHE